mmetsp:Transcript_34438/g.50581  ORF Transcript_34438/g.50581 Transcript_34438/m.50581 type:complete len:212 (+) Transcript_34438:126-761(+)|eukprot:CAMPEP_0195508476 /NCGR_PEP_ID=MMETSP0794_2-20130614/1673_1 /TAXON_ID=515487 /ORGANISM="Stephanopyxis turris, Strain CCMP 815" /LENGTH=211 /DNA_ID=CAMNT_0040635445 /DNA_START=125 /DNA_END=760 /DNA_ORIENTATION=-
MRISLAALTSILAWHALVEGPTKTEAFVHQNNRNRLHASNNAFSEIEVRHETSTPTRGRTRSCVLLFSTEQSEGQFSTKIAREIDDVRNSLGFRNDGKYWFMKTVMAGYKEGKRVVMGVPVGGGDPSQQVSDGMVAERRALAAAELVNIGTEERELRENVGNALLSASALYAVYLALFVDQGDAFGHVVRFSVYPLFTTGYALRVSGKKGM